MITITVQVVDIWLHDANLLHYFAAELHYSPDFFSPDYFANSRFPLPVISFGVGLKNPNFFYYDEEIPLHPSGYVHVSFVNEPEISGNGYIARVYFQDKPEVSYVETHTPLPTAYDDVMCLDYDGGYTLGILNWYYVNFGDYNQDGGVWLDDLIQLGRFFNTYVPDFYYDDPWAYSEYIESVVDGNHNGIIQIDDLAAIGRNLGASVSGYYIYMGPAPLDHPEAAPLGYVSLAEAEDDPFSKRLRLSFRFDNPVPGYKLWIRPEFNGQIGEVPERAVVTIPAD